MTRWGMVVDLARCVGCQTCTIACKMENGLPPGTLWRTVLDVEGGEFPDVTRTFVPLTCMQCSDPPCLDACPTTATRVRPDGIVIIENAICIGCGSCVVACPYQARHLVPRERYYFGEPTPPELATYDRSRIGICTKCQFCSHKLDSAPASAIPGVNPEFTPVCSSSCIANAILFGDFEDPASPVSRKLAERGPGVRMLEHLGTQPNVVYLNPPPAISQAPRLQHSWRGLAVSNFFCGPAGAGLYTLAVVLAWLQGRAAPLIQVQDWSRPWAGAVLAPPTWQHWAGLLAPLLTAIGLLSVAVEAGRPWRGLNVLRNVGRSWMSRESVFAMGFMALAWLNVLLLAQPVVQAVAAVTGLGVAVAQGMILSQAKGVPAWNVPIMPLYFVTSGLVAGAGLLLSLLAAAGFPAPGISWAAALGIAFIAADLAVWVRYLATPPKTRTFELAIQVLKTPFTQWSIVGAGHVLPALLLAAGWHLGEGAWLVAGGILMLGGGLIAKAALILNASFLVDLFDRFGASASQAGERHPAPVESPRRAA